MPDRSDGGEALARSLWSAYDKARKRAEKVGGPDRQSTDPKVQKVTREVETARNALLEHYLFLVKRAAERLERRLPNGVEVDDLMAEGLFGLMHAVDAYNAERGVRFETFALYGIRGAMLDYLRSLDPLPRLERARLRRMTQAREKLLKRLGRQPTEEELQSYLKLPDAKFKKHVRAENAPSFGSLDQPNPNASGDRESRGYHDLLADENAVQPLTTVARDSLKAYITRGLETRERLMVVLYYYEHMSMSEVGITLGTSESRVSQVLKSVRERLQSRFDDAAKAELIEAGS